MNENIFASANTAAMAKQAYPSGARSGSSWTTSDDALLIEYFKQGMSLVNMARHCERSATAVLSRLAQTHKLIDDDRAGNFIITTKGQARRTKETEMNETSIPQAKSPKIPAMEAYDTGDALRPTIETVVLIHGQRADKMSDDQIFSMIANLEAKVTSYDDIKNKPKKLVAKIDAIKADIAKLVEYVDSRA